MSKCRGVHVWLVAALAAGLLSGCASLTRGRPPVERAPEASSAEREGTKERPGRRTPPPEAGGSAAFVVMLKPDPSYTLFYTVPSGEELEEIAADMERFEGEWSYEGWADFRREVRSRVGESILSDEFRDPDLGRGLVALLLKYPRTTVGVTWNGGIAFDAPDYERAAEDYAAYLANPEAHAASRENDPRLQFKELLGW